MAGHIFISYARADAGYVERLTRYLADAGLTVWADTEIITGGQWASVITDQIDTAAAVVVVMSPASRESAWVRREINFAQDRGKPIVPLLLSGQVPIQLNDIQYENVQGDRLPSSALIERLRAVVAQSSAGPAGPKIDVPESIASPGRFRVFVNYRREDSAFATQWLISYLSGLPDSAYGIARDSIFVDVHTIGYGYDWEHAITDAIKQCRIMLVIIGPKWAGGGATRRLMHARRLDDRADHVRREIEVALEYRVHIIPVLVGPLEMPRAAHLPRSLRPLTRRQWATLHADQFEADSSRLAREMSEILALKTPPMPQRWVGV